MDLGAETILRVLLRDEATGAPLGNQSVRFGIEGKGRIALGHSVSGLPEETIYFEVKG